MTSLVRAPSLYIISQLSANLTHSIMTTAVDDRYVSFSTLRVYFIDSTSAEFCTHRHTSAMATIVRVGPMDLMLLAMAELSDGVEAEWERERVENVMGEGDGVDLLERRVRRGAGGVRRGEIGEANMGG